MAGEMRCRYLGRNAGRELPADGQVLSWSASRGAYVPRTVNGGTPDPHAASHKAEGSDELGHDELAGSGSNTHEQIDGHLGSTDNPHAVSHSQVGSASAYWNASKLQGRGVETAEPDNDDVLKWNAAASEWQAQPGGAAGPHASSHELAGGDQIDVTGLSGVLADAWGAAGSSLGVALAAGVLYFVAVSVNTTGTTAGPAAMGATTAAGTGSIQTAPQSLPGNLAAGAGYLNGYEFQFATSGGALPATAPTLAAHAAAWTGGMPAFFLDANNG
jgi:hypothetical protein